MLTAGASQATTAGYHARPDSTRRATVAAFGTRQFGAQSCRLDPFSAQAALDRRQGTARRYHQARQSLFALSPARHQIQGGTNQLNAAGAASTSENSAPSLTACRYASPARTYRGPGRSVWA